MTSSQPPFCAIQLMQSAGVDPAIIGDLIEEYSTGYSSVWFWKQAFGTLVTKAPRLSRYVLALRWLAALPLAILSVRLIDEVALGLPLLFVRDYSHTAALAPVVSFLIAATFLIMAVRVIPNRRDLAARIGGIAVVCGAAALMMRGSTWGVSSLLGLKIFLGPEYFAWKLAMGLSAMLGGAAASTYESRRERIRRS